MQRGEEIDRCSYKQDLMTQKETLSVGNAHSPRGGGQTNNPTTIIQGKDFYNKQA